MSAFRAEAATVKIRALATAETHKHTQLRSLDSIKAHWFAPIERVRVAEAAIKKKRADSLGGPK